MKPIITIVIAVTVVHACFADTWIVDPLEGDFTSIQDAIDASSNGDDIQINAGTYYESGVNTNGKVLYVIGATNADGTPAVTIDAQQNDAVLIIWSGESELNLFENLIFTGGEYGWGGGLMMFNSSPSFTNCTFTGNTATQQGGGVYL